MTSKKTETGAGPICVKKRYMSADQCKATAARISAEMREDREGREKWGSDWVAYGPNGPGKKPATLVIPGDFDQAQAVIEHLYHPEEAKLIIESLTP